MSQKNLLYKICKLIESALNFIAMIGERRINGTIPPGLIGWRLRFRYLAIAFGWLAISPKSSLWYFNHGLIGYWGPADYRNPRKWFGRA